MSKKRGRLLAVKLAAVIRVLLRNGFRELKPTKHQHFTDETIHAPIRPPQQRASLP